MTNLQIFNYENKVVRTVMIDGEPWLVLKDICDVLGLSNPTIVATRLDDDEFQHLDFNPKFDLRLGHNGATIINESGLYNVIFRSDKPKAKKFRRWVTHEVLPEIRKTGGYNSDLSVGERIKIARIISKTPKQAMAYVLQMFGMFPVEATFRKTDELTNFLNTTDIIDMPTNDAYKAYCGHCSAPLPQIEFSRQVKKRLNCAVISKKINNVTRRVFVR